MLLFVLILAMNYLLYIEVASEAMWTQLMANPVNQIPAREKYERQGAEARGVRENDGKYSRREKSGKEQRRRPSERKIKNRRK